MCAAACIHRYRSNSNVFKTLCIAEAKHFEIFSTLFLCVSPLSPQHIEEVKMKTDVTANIYPISFALFTYNKTFSNFDNNTTKQILHNDGDKQTLTHTLYIVQNVLNNSPFFINIFLSENLITHYVTLYAVSVKTKSFVTELRPSEVCLLT